jgi:hypothetical protein
MKHMHCFYIGNEAGREPAMNLQVRADIRVGQFRQAFCWKMFLEISIFRKTIYAESIFWCLACTGKGGGDGE